MSSSWRIRNRLAALAYFLKYAEIHVFNGKRTLRESVSLLMQYVEEHGLAAVTESSYVPCGLAMPRGTGDFCMHQPLQKNQFVGKGTGGNVSDKANIAAAVLAHVDAGEDNFIGGTAL